MVAVDGRSGDGAGARQAGESRPDASSLNPDPGAVSANLVIAKVGDDGNITIYNNRGDVDLLADVTAYFT